MATTAEEERRTTTTALPVWRRIVLRIGVVLTTIMAIFNTVNGGSRLLGIIPADGYSALIGALLFCVGLPTLLLVALAWIPVQWALITVIALRALEALTMWIPFGPGDWYDAPDRRPFYTTLVIVALIVCALMAAGLRRRGPRPLPSSSAAATMST